MNYARALAKRRRAVQACRAARDELDAASSAAVLAYRAHPLPVLAVAAGTGFVLSRLSIGHNFMHGVARLASGPGWRLVQQWLPGLI